MAFYSIRAMYVCKLLGRGCCYIEIGGGGGGGIAYASQWKLLSGKRIYLALQYHTGFTLREHGCLKADQFSWWSLLCMPTGAYAFVLTQLPRMM